ncbi:hypothetical protein GCM10028803_52090 [Larkinella knui]
MITFQTHHGAPPAKVGIGGVSYLAVVFFNPVLIYEIVEIFIRSNVDNLRKYRMGV